MGKRLREKKERREREPFSYSRPTGPRENLLLNTIRWATYFALFTPLIVNTKFFFPFVFPKSLYFMALSEIIFFSWLIFIFYSPQFRQRLVKEKFNPLLIALSLFLIVLILATIFSQDPSRSFWSKPERMTGLLMWFHLFAFFLVISSVFKKEDWQKIFSISIFVGVILSFITFFSKNPAMRGGATLGNDSFLGTYLIFNLFLALYLIFTSQKEVKIYSGICFLIIFLGLFLSGARAAKLSFLGGLALLFFLYLIFIPQKRYLNFLGKFLLAVSLIVFLVSVYLLLFQPESLVHQKFIKLATKSRLVIWEKAWKGFLERPLLGWGPENFDFIFTKYFNPCMFLSECGGEIWFDRAHNIIFDTLVSSGIFGLLTYFGIFLSAFYLLWRNYFRKRVEFWTTGIFTCLLISYFVQNLTVFDMISSYLTFFLVLGFVASITTTREEAFPAKSVLPNYLIISFVLILFVFSFFKFIIQPLKTDYYVIAALRAPPASEKRLSYYQKTLQSSPLGKYQIRDFFGQTILEFARSEKIKEASVENFKNEIDFVIAELEKSKIESPLDFRSQLKLGQLYNIYAALIDSTKISEAERVLEKGIEISPTNQQGYWALAQTRLFQRRFEDALSLAEKAIELEPKLFQSHQIVIQIAEIIGDNELVRKKVDQAIKINPDWKNDLTNILQSANI